MLSAFLAVSCLGITITVDDDDPCADFNNIQEATDFAVDGDTVQVLSGTYNESVNFYGKRITVTGVYSPMAGSPLISNSIDYGSTVTFDSGEGQDSQLIGMDIDNPGDDFAEPRTGRHDTYNDTQTPWLFELIK